MTQVSSIQQLPTPHKLQAEALETNVIMIKAFLYLAARFRPVSELHLVMIEREKS